MRQELPPLEKTGALLELQRLAQPRPLSAPQPILTPPPPSAVSGSDAPGRRLPAESWGPLA